jgi:hypothetical protein
MPRDYSRQKKAPQKKARAKSKPAGRNRRNNAHEGVQWGTFGSGMIVGILCTLAAAFLPSQFPGLGPTHNAPDQPSGGQQALSPKTNFEFFDRLPADKVAIQRDTYEDLRPQKITQTMEYLLQAVSFRKAEDAERLRARLLLSGMEAFTERTSVNGSVWYRVLVGPFPNKTELNRAQTKLREQNLNPLPITRPLPG